MTSLDFLQPGQPWPPESEVERLNRYKANRHLFNGDHEKVFKGWTRIIRHDESAAIEQILNYPKRVSTLWADLLFGEPPRFTASGDEEVPPPEARPDGRFIEYKTKEQEACDRIVQDNSLIKTAYEVQLDTSALGDGLYVISLENRQAIIEAQPPEHWFPVVEPDNAKRIRLHVLAWTVTRETQDWRGERTEEAFLRVQIHERGRIENRLYRLSQAAKHARQLGSRLNLGVWDDNIPESVSTNIDEFLVVHVPNLQTTKSIFGLDDYKDIYMLVESMAIRLAQNDHILDKHADPSMYGDPNQVQIDPRTGQYVFIGGGRWFNVVEDETPPNYITWDGQLTASFEQFDVMQRQFYIVSETSQAAFGQMDRVIAESGTALRRLMMVPLAKVNRSRLFIDPRLQQVIKVAAGLERASGAQTPELKHVEIEWHDGLPEDPKEQAEIEERRMRAGNTSTYSSISRLDGGTEASVLEEHERIRKELAETAGVATGGVPPLQLRFDAEEGNQE